MTTTKTISPLEFIQQDMAARKADSADEEKLQYKYHSIDTFNKETKINALKDVNLDPYRLKDPYDGLANSFHRWKTVANDAVLNHYDEATKNKVASHYYDKMVAPLYGAMGQKPMDKELWLKQAYKEATNYNIEDSYNNSIIHDLKHGWDSGLAATARAYGYVTNMLGEAEKTHLKGLGVEPQQTPKESIADAIVRGARIQGDNHQFWADALPDKGGWIAKATGFFTEQAGQLPVYISMGMAGKAVGALGEGFNLTKNLLSNPIGKRAIPYLMAGGEGLAYGTLTRPQNDKNQAWRDAVGFTIFHGLFDIGGMGLKKLIDIVPPDNTGLLDKLKKRQDALELAQEGKRNARPGEVYDQHKKEVANNLAVVGVAGQRNIFASALRHIENMESVGWTREQIKDHEMTLLDEDPARNSPMLSAAKYVRSVLGATGKKLNDIKEGSEDEKFLSSRIGKLIFDAGSEMHTHVDGIKEETIRDVVANAKEPAAKNTIEFYRAKVAAELAKEHPGAVSMMKPEEIESLAVKKMAEDTQKGIEEAEKKLSTNPISKATEINAKAKAPVVKNTPALKVRSERTTNKYGEPAVRYSVNPEFKVQLKTYIKTAKEKGQSLTEFFEDMSDEDFANDLNTHFYPQALKDSKIFFEKQNTKEGSQNPNFLGFMYNYANQMPEEFGKELEERLINSMKVQKYMNGRKPTEPQLMYFARAMYNHMDNFLGSGKWPKESNIFRSTQDKMWQSTKWQMQLLREKHIQEVKNIKDMFSSDPVALKNALTTYKLFAKKRMEQYKIGPKDLTSQHKISKIDDDIADLQTRSGEYERIPF